MFRESILPEKKILISGAGIAGLALARQLRKLNIPFMIIEKKPYLITEGVGIALPANAMQALRHMGLGEELEHCAHQVKKIIYTDSDGNILNESSLLEYPLNTDRFTALHRHQLHQILGQGLEDIIHFDTTINEVRQMKNGIYVSFNKPYLKPQEFSAIIGADGIHSQIRKYFFPDNLLLDLEVTTWRWTCKLPTDDLQPTYMWGLHGIFMAYPIAKDEVYCYAHVLDTEGIYTKSSDHRSNLIELFRNYAGIAKRMLAMLPENPFIISGRLRSVSPPSFLSKRILLIGDAAHACSPMLQQGAACALEDAIVLAKLLGHFPVESALSHYAHFRVKRVNLVTSLSDDPIKMLINVKAETLPLIYQKIRENGPLNVQGWKKLLTEPVPAEEIEKYIKQQKIHSKNLSILTAKL